MTIKVVVSNAAVVEYDYATYREFIEREANRLMRADGVALVDAVATNGSLGVFLTNPNGEVRHIFTQTHDQAVTITNKLRDFLYEWVEHANRQHVETR